MSIDVKSFLAELDGFFSRDEPEQAEKFLRYWQKQAREENDTVLRITVLNEAVGFARANGIEDWAMETRDEVLELVDRGAVTGSALGTTYINIATAMNRFGYLEQAVYYYDKAEINLLENGAPWYLIASLYNNRAGAQMAAGDYDNGVADLQKALNSMAGHPEVRMEQATSCANLSDLLRQLGREEESQNYMQRMRAVLDDPDFPHDSTYADTCYKCAPVYARRGDTAAEKALIDTAEAIYAAYRSGEMK